MAKDNKFGTFGGVYTPSLLTILGVIMYLRLPWVIGNAGLTLGLGIILVAHVISVCTGLSISSIATDKNVGAGGPYYIVSRSLGLPIGGTLGLALFVGLSFSISLYIIGFCESILGLLESYGVEPSIANIRIAGSVTLILLTIITLISTAFAIKTQYVIFSLIALSLVSIVLGSPEPPGKPLLDPAPEMADPGVLFGIFFPAVTGFTAGVNMSGDLKNPKQSIPRGTMLAIGTGLLVYVGLAVFLALRVPRDKLLENPTILVDVARVDWVVLGGIWGATLSSALGSILGAPRILQAMSADRITPAWFARGYGKGHEPRNALVLAFLIGLSGILIAELNVIASIVSMIFLATYGFLNISCAIESWASPDFRPEFRIPKSVSVLGAVTTLIVMIQLDIAAMAGSVVLLAGIYAWLQRRQLQLDSGDTWEGFWASLVRSGLYRLSQQRQQHRNWRPNVLMFRSAAPTGASLLGFAHSLVGGNGMLTDVRLTARESTPSKARGQNDSKDELVPVGVFHRDLVTNNRLETIGEVCRYHGFAGLQPNTVLLDWQEYLEDAEGLSRTVSLLTELDYNLLIYAGLSSNATPPASNEPAGNIDIWWRQGAGNLRLSLALVRFITSAEEYEKAAIRFVLVSDDSASGDILRARMRRMLSEARVSAQVQVVNNARERLPLSSLIENHSKTASLVVAGLSDNPAANDAAGLQRLSRLLDSLNAVLLVRSSSAFTEDLGVGRKISDSLVPAAPDTEHPVIDSLKRWENTQVQARLTQLAARYESAVLGLHEHAIARLYVPQVELLRGLRAATERRASQLVERLSGENPRKQRKLLSRIHSSFLLEVRKLFEQLVERALPEQRDALDGRIEAFLHDDRLSPRDPSEVLWVSDKRERFLPASGDTRFLRRFKRWRRLVAFLKRSLPSYPVPLGALELHARERLRREVLLDAVQRVTSDCHELIVHLGKQLNASDTVLDLLRGLEEGQDVTVALKEHRRRALDDFDVLIDGEKERIGRSRSRIVERTRSILEQYAGHIEQLDMKKRRKSVRVKAAQAARLERELGEMAEPWHENQRTLVERALLSLELSAFQHRLTAIVSREREALSMEFKTGLLRDTDELRARLGKLKELLVARDPCAEQVATQVVFEHQANFDPNPIIERLTREAELCAQDLPDSVNTLDNDSIDRLAEDGSRVTDVERIQLSVRPLVQFSVEANLIGMLSEQLQRLPTVEQRASAAGHDVARLVAFQVTEFEAEGARDAEEFAQHVLPAVESSLERITLEHAKAENELGRVLATFDERLSALLVGTGVYELAAASDTLDDSRRRERGRKAVTGVRGVWQRLGETARRASVMGLYRVTAGLVLAKRVRRVSASGENTVELVLADVAAHSPPPEVVQKLPYYYRQLFFGQATLNENFWVNRESQVALAKTALSNFKRGVAGCLIIQGERGSGKSALWQHLVSRLLERQPVLRVHPRAGGSADPKVFETAFRQACGQQGDVAELVRRQEPGSLIVLDDFELWWERTPKGLQVVDLVLDLIDRFGDRCLFLLCMNSQAYHFLCRLRPLGERALGVIECSWVAAETLKEIITLRHGSTGVSYTLEGVHQDSLSQWAIARLFAAHFHYSRGLIGPALQSWVTHVKRFDKDRISIVRPSSEYTHGFDQLSAEHLGVLIQLCLHKQLSIERLLRLRQGPRHTTNQLVASLRRMGLVVEVRPRVYEINRFIHHILSDRLRQRGLLS